MKLFKCCNCGRTFEADKPTCAACQLDPETDGRDAQSFVELKRIHFDPPHRTVGGRGMGHAACDPKKRVGTGDQFTGELAQVNCKACQEAAAKMESLPHALPSDAIRMNNLDEERAKALAASQ